MIYDIGKMLKSLSSYITCTLISFKGYLLFYKSKIGIHLLILSLKESFLFLFGLKLIVSSPLDLRELYFSIWF